MRLLLSIISSIILSFSYSQDIASIFNKISETDTLKFSAHINDSTDCGEFGGHNEYLKVVRLPNDQFKINYQRLPSNCPWVRDSTSVEQEIMLAKSKNTLLEDFLIDLEKLKNTDTGFSNGYQVFIVEFKTDTIKVWDGLGLWLGYEVFRNKILN
ncbi:MAG: hypothetical protein H6600_07015 [Flavobacteriales bacterium]|nr:hypothetical protein [Flavobacteriales bacterium]